MVEGVSLPSALPVQPDLARVLDMHRAASWAVTLTVLAAAARNIPPDPADRAMTVEFAVLVGGSLAMLWVVARYGLTSRLAHPLRFVGVLFGGTTWVLAGLWLSLAGDGGTRVLLTGAAVASLVRASRAWRVRRSLRVA